MKKYILLVWEIIPEAVHLYLIPKDEICESHSKLLNFANLKLINACENSELDRLDELNELLDNEWSSYKVEKELLRLEDDQHIERVITSGFVL